MDLPEGFVLGPNLFLIYVSDLTQSLPDGIKLIADDT